MASLLGVLVRAPVGLASKLFLRLGCTTTVTGLPRLLAALHNEERRNGQGVITASNHISTIDDPLCWGTLPTRFHLTSRMMRWTLGASDVMFTNPVFSEFFRRGQVIETFRGRGIFQPAVDSAIKQLDKGDWIHLFPESKINQSVAETPNLKLPRFKWGTGRVIMSTTKLPTVIPMWLSGFDRVMPEGRRFPFKYLPRLNQHLSVTFGEPVAADRLADIIRNAKDDIDCRIKITALLQREVEALGRDVVARRLDKQ